MYFFILDIPALLTSNRKSDSNLEGENQVASKIFPISNSLHSFERAFLEHEYVGKLHHLRST